MDDVRASGAVIAKPAPAMVVRQFAGSRVERQLLARVFDWAWQAGGRGAPRVIASDDRDDGCSSAEASLTSFCHATLTEGVVS